MAISILNKESNKVQGDNDVNDELMLDRVNPAEPPLLGRVWIFLFNEILIKKHLLETESFTLICPVLVSHQQVNKLIDFKFTRFVLIYFGKNVLEFPLLNFFVMALLGLKSVVNQTMNVYKHLISLLLIKLTIFSGTELLVVEHWYEVILTVSFVFVDKEFKLVLVGSIKQRCEKTEHE